LTHRLLRLAALAASALTALLYLPFPEHSVPRINAAIFKIGRRDVACAGYC
jgi:hypothetical protein